MSALTVIDLMQNEAFILPIESDQLSFFYLFLCSCNLYAIEFFMMHEVDLMYVAVFVGKES